MVLLFYQMIASKSNMSSAIRSLLVFGGNGFLGKRICQAGIQAGLNVTSVSRSGKPPKSVSIHDEYWMTKVNWSKADIMNPETYKIHLINADAVVHSIGILLENQSYKKTINSNYGILSDLRNYSNYIKGPDPMEKNANSSYNAIQRDSALLLANAFIETTESKNPTFVYVSADKQIPLIPTGYITSKREAELELSLINGLRTIIMRPGFMFDQESKHTVRDALSAVLQCGYSAKEKLIGDKLGLANEIIRPVVSTQQVGLIAVDKICDDTFNGIVYLDEIKDI